MWRGFVHLMSSGWAIRWRVSRYRRLLHCVRLALALGLLSSAFAYFCEIWCPKASIHPFGYLSYSGNKLLDKKKAAAWIWEEAFKVKKTMTRNLKAEKYTVYILFGTRFYLNLVDSCFKLFSNLFSFLFKLCDVSCQKHFWKEQKKLGHAGISYHSV